MNRKWKIEVTEEQLELISEALEFTSRFHCGQIGSTYLPGDTLSVLFEPQYEGEDTYTRREEFDIMSALMARRLHPDLKGSSNKGVGYHQYSDHLYDMYKMMKVELKKERDKELPPEEISWNVNNHFTSFSDKPNIKVTPTYDDISSGT